MQEEREVLLDEIKRLKAWNKELLKQVDLLNKDVIFYKEKNKKLKAIAYTRRIP